MKEEADAEERMRIKAIDREYFQKLIDLSFGDNELIIERPDGVRFIIQKKIDRDKTSIDGEAW